MIEHRLCGANASKLKQNTNQVDKERPLWNDDVKTKSLGYFDKSLSKNGILRPLSSQTRHKTSNRSIPNAMNISKSSRSATNPRQNARKKHENKAKKDFIRKNIERVTGMSMRERDLIERRKARRRISSRPIDLIRSPRSTKCHSNAHSKVLKNLQKSVEGHNDVAETSKGKIQKLETHDWDQSSTFAARVFAELDQDGRNAIGIEQIIHGLRLLGLPATHNQVADYVYLIHEGESDCINEEEWEILVSTLDAASVHSVYPNQHYTTINATSTIPLNTQPVKPSRPESASIKTSKASPKRLQERAATTHIDQSFIKDLHGKVDEMVEQAYQAAYIRWNPSGASNNQKEAQLNPEKALNRAVTIMSGLKSTFYPLVHQAEETLKELRKRHGANLSLIVPAEDLSRISFHSEELASNILDDLLLDTIHCLNQIERQKTQQKLQSEHLQQLAAIADRIGRIEMEEAQAKKLVENLDEPSESAVVPTDPVTFNTSRNDPVTILDSPLRQRIEKQKRDFAFHRRLVEASLESTGMSQSCVVEILEDLILEDLMIEAASELENNVHILADAMSTLL
ncbi:unnamed protein product [Albugo candida]|uniref:EF-hand domain-containing protein n=1 Tax=Albugo candida TaxID=65357 RepID=A0A024G2D6_9STRA|nr:unnamed protein product [Albugo candida]|eukprot:CCI40905.1 unnamed protein product [Albugo candida]